MDPDRPMNNLRKKLFKDLYVLGKQAWFPLEALMVLWDMCEENATYYANVFGNRALATVSPPGEWEGSPCGYGAGSFALSLHDVMVDFIEIEEVPHVSQQKALHEEFLRRYAQRLGNDVEQQSSSTTPTGCRPWWNLKSRTHRSHHVEDHRRASGLMEKPTALRAHDRYQSYCPYHGDRPVTPPCG